MGGGRYDDAFDVFIYGEEIYVFLSGCKPIQICLALQRIQRQRVFASEVEPFAEKSKEREQDEVKRFLASKSARLTNIAHQIWKIVLQPGDTVCDATCGNGNDSIFLAQAVGNQGRLVCIDLQEQAVEATRDNIEKTIDQNELPSVEYIVGSHEHVTEYLGSNVARLICFNLGYLPGGDKSVVTETDSTLAAIEGSLESLCFGGLISILCYTGHPGGQEEYESVKEFVEQLCSTYWKVSQIQLLNSPSAPIMILIWKLE